MHPADQDKFVAVVNAKVEVSLPLSCFRPWSTLENRYPLSFLFPEIADEHFTYPSPALRQGHRNFDGLHLPQEVLHNLCRENALRLLSSDAVRSRRAHPTEMREA